MAQIVGIRFKSAGKIYYFDPADIRLEKGDYAVVDTARGMECGEVVIANRDIQDDAVNKPLRPVLRKASEEDVRRAEENQAKKRQTMNTCQQRIDAHKLDMKLVDVEFAFDNSKILFYFTADGRVDFRELVKDLASVFRTRIELRQIGVRDEAKMLGGLGICGRPFCCSQFLGDFQPVSIKMAKEQGLSLNPTKISGSCGRLMCCLKYEQDAYEHLLKTTPKQGAIVNTRDGRGVVQEVNLLTGMLKVKLDKAPDSPPVSMSREDVKVIRDGRVKVEKQEEESLSGLEG
ncbi:MAG: stage 0 sporulation family protein [Acutalibacteraceae bacterium]